MLFRSAEEAAFFAQTLGDGVSKGSLRGYHVVRVVPKVADPGRVWQYNRWARKCLHVEGEQLGLLGTLSVAQIVFSEVCWWRTEWSCGGRS